MKRFGLLLILLLTSFFAMSQQIKDELVKTIRLIERNFPLPDSASKNNYDFCLIDLTISPKGDLINVEILHSQNDLNQIKLSYFLGLIKNSWKPTKSFCGKVIIPVLVMNVSEISDESEIDLSKKMTVDFFSKLAKKKISSNFHISRTAVVSAYTLKRVE